MSSRIPPLLEPYLALPPEASLILLTSVLGASSNWLVLRFLHSTLIGLDPVPAIQDDGAKVVLVSFMRDFAFWRENSKRLVSVFGSEIGFSGSHPFVLIHFSDFCSSENTRLRKRAI